MYYRQGVVLQLDVRLTTPSLIVSLFPFGATAPSGPGPPYSRVPILFTTTHHSPLDERSAGRRGLYLTHTKLTTENTSMPPVVFEPTFSAGKRPRTYALNRAATGTGS
jgi:hypothetical protein